MCCCQGQPMVCFLTEQLAHTCTGLRTLGIAHTRKKKACNECRESPTRVTAGISKHSYIHICFQIAQLKWSKWSSKYSQMLLCECGNICCFKTWVQSILLLFFFIKHQIFNRSVHAKRYNQTPKRFQLRNAATTHQHRCLDCFHILVVEQSSTL